MRAIRGPNRNAHSHACTDFATINSCSHSHQGWDANSDSDTNSCNYPHAHGDTYSQSNAHCRSFCYASFKSLKQNSHEKARTDSYATFSTASPSPSR